MVSGLKLEYSSRTHHCNPDNSVCVCVCVCVCVQVWEGEMGISAIQRGEAFMDGMVDRLKDWTNTTHEQDRYVLVSG